MESKNLKKLEDLKSKVNKPNIKMDNSLEEVIREILKEELEFMQERIYKGISKIIFGGRDEVKAVDEKVNKLLKMAEVEGKESEIMEIWEKLNQLTRRGE